ncbi:MAG TPA: DUF1269 domain-containing protein [Burkholderiales bacterium]|nr:DUF1269 domain-containing protein [Burkholderiales bacterium]
MKRRLYFVLPDVTSTRRVADELLLARVSDRHMHVLAQRGTELGALREASVWQKSDLVHGAEVGMVIGGIGGFLLGLMVVLTPPNGVEMQMITVLISSVIGAIFGAWSASLIGASTPNSRLKRFQADIDAGQILLMVDVPAARVDEIRDLVSRRHPEAQGGSMEPTLPAFP